MSEIVELILRFIACRLIMPLVLITAFLITLRELVSREHDDDQSD